VKDLYLGFCKAEKPHIIYEKFNRVSFFGKWNNGLIATLDDSKTHSAIVAAMNEANFSNFEVLKDKIVSQDSEIKICLYTKYETSG